MENHELDSLFKRQEVLDKHRHQRAETLKNKIEELSEKLDEGATEEITQLRSTLGVAKEKLIEQNTLLQRLTAPPLVMAFVLRVEAGEPIRDSFAVGRRVKILSSAPNSNHYGETGTIMEGVNKEGEIIVKFSDGDRERHMVNLFPMGLSIPGKPNAKRDDFRKGVKVKIVGPNIDGDEGRIGQIDKIRIYNDDPDRPWCRVYNQNGDSHREWYWIGPKEVHLEPLDWFTGTALVFHEGKQIEVELQSDMEVKPGDTVKLSMQSMQIVDVAVPVYAGEISIVRRAIDDTTSEVEHGGAVRVVLNGKLTEKPEVGDRVVLDSAALVIGMNLGKEDERFSFTSETNVKWNDIGGLAEAKAQMIEAIELPFRYPEIYAHYHKKPIKGVLLYGPPGCGKTMLGKAAATALAELHNGNASSSGFIYVKGPEILDRFVGVAESTIRQIFQRSRKHKEQHGYPAVVFIDEADAILGKRGMGISSDIERTIVPQFLAEMDGLEETGAIVLLATNRADILDPAITRDGRVDRKVKISRPNMDDSRDIFGLYLKNTPLYNGYTRDELSNVAACELFSDKRVLYSIQLNGNHKGETRSFTLGNLASGAMVAGIVDQATSISLHRDIKSGKPEGMSKDDLVQAVGCVFQQNFDLNHNDEIADFTHDFRDDIVGIRKLRQGAGAAAN
jgi:proteasome-associated ATPase